MRIVALHVCTVKLPLSVCRTIARRTLLSSGATQATGIRSFGYAREASAPIDPTPT